MYIHRKQTKKNRQKKKNRRRPPGDPGIDLLAQTICWSVAISSDIGRDTFNQNSDRFDREKWSTSKGETFLLGPNRSIEFWTEISSWSYFRSECLFTVTMYSLYIRPFDIRKRGCWNYSHYSKPQYFTRTCDNLSRKCFLLFRLTYRDARPRDDRNRKYFMEFAPFIRFLHWFTIFHPIFLHKPNWSSFFY